MINATYVLILLYVNNVLMIIIFQMVFALKIVEMIIVSYVSMPIVAICANQVTRCIVVVAKNAPTTLPTVLLVQIVKLVLAVKKVMVCKMKVVLKVVRCRIAPRVSLIHRPARPAILVSSAMTRYALAVPTCWKAARNVQTL